MFLSLVLPLGHLVDGVQIIRNDKLPIAEPLAEHFFSFPSEEFLCCRRPAQYFEFMIPLDDGEGSVLDVKSESLVIVER